MKQNVVNLYAGDNDYHEFVDANMDNPWARLVIGRVDDMKQYDFNTYMLQKERKDKLTKLKKLNENL